MSHNTDISFKKNTWNTKILEMDADLADDFVYDILELGKCFSALNKIFLDSLIQIKNKIK